MEECRGGRGTPDAQTQHLTHVAPSGCPAVHCTLTPKLPAIHLSTSMTTTKQPSDAQREFNRKYVTSTEILKRLDIARSTLLLARRSGRLPNPIEIPGQTFVWVRSEVEPYLSAWELMRGASRGEAA